MLSGAVVGIFGQEKIAHLQQANAAILYFVQSRYFYDNLVNKMALVSLKISTKIYIALDKGILE